MISGVVEGNQIYTDYSTGKLSISDDTLTITDTTSGETGEYIKESSLPVVCYGDAIEITYFTPETAIEGVPTTFLVNFDYRLSSVDSATVYLGFNTDFVNGFSLSDNTLGITEQGTGTGSFSQEVSPVFYAAPDSFKMSVILVEGIQPNISFSARSYQIAEIPVAQSSVITNQSLQSSPPDTHGRNILKCAFNLNLVCRTAP